MKDEELLKNMLLKIAKPVFDKFAYVRNFKFIIDNRYKDSEMWYIDFIHEVNDIDSSMLCFGSMSHVLEHLKDAREKVPIRINDAKNIFKKLDKLIVQLENIQKKTEESENKLRIIINEDFPEWKNRHDNSEEMMNVYYKVFPIDKIERVYVTADRKKGINFSAINF
jgi:hypothetical protein